MGVIDGRDFCRLALSWHQESISPERPRSVPVYSSTITWIRPPLIALRKAR